MTLNGLEFKRISKDIKAQLVIPFTEEEMLATIKKLKEDKALGLDGFLIKFFKVFWHVMSEDIMKVLFEFYNQALWCQSLKSFSCLNSEKEWGNNDKGL